MSINVGGVWCVNVAVGECEPLVRGLCACVCVCVTL